MVFNWFWSNGKKYFWFSEKTEDSLACTMSDLEVNCDRQLPSIRGIVDESIGVNRDSIKLITKVLPCWKNIIGTTHGVSKESYCREKKLLGVTGQGNEFSGSVCRDISYFILKELEKKIGNCTDIKK